MTEPLCPGGILGYRAAEFTCPLGDMPCEKRNRLCRRWESENNTRAMSSNTTRPVRKRQPHAGSSAPTGHRDMESVYAATHVVKRFSASQPGALKLARRFGDALVCVRYRHDPQGRHRYTTVELVVDEAPVAQREDPNAIVMVCLAFDEIELRQLVLAHGARWDARQRLWSMPRRTAKKLKLLARVVKP